MEQRVGQAICGVCGKTVGYGKGTVLGFGAGGRVHTDKCLTIAQKVIPLRRSTPAQVTGSGAMLSLGK